jgi:hypothetical protein
MGLLFIHSVSDNNFCNAIFFRYCLQTGADHSLRNTGAAGQLYFILMGRNHLGDLHMLGMIILKLQFKKQGE